MTTLNDPAFWESVRSATAELEDQISSGAVVDPRLAVLQELVAPKWRPIELAPWEVEVLVCGPSGYVPPHDKFIINAYRVRDWHGGGWNDATGTPLMDQGWEPRWWCPRPVLP